jgi:hypothetical protein
MRLSKPIRAIGKIGRVIILWQNFGGWMKPATGGVCPTVKIYACEPQKA